MDYCVLKHLFKKHFKEDQKLHWVAYCFCIQLQLCWEYFPTFFTATPGKRFPLYMYLLKTCLQLLDLLTAGTEGKKKKNQSQIIIMATPFKSKANFLLQTNKISRLHLVFTGSNRITLRLFLAFSPALYLCFNKNACFLQPAPGFHIGKFQLNSSPYSRGSVPHILE